MNATATIPGTAEPLCEVCRDRPATKMDAAIGPVCVGCLPALGHATAALAGAGLYHPLPHYLRKNAQ